MKNYYKNGSQISASRTRGVQKGKMTKIKNVVKIAAFRTRGVQKKRENDKKRCSDFFCVQD